MTLSELTEFINMESFRRIGIVILFAILLLVLTAHYRE